MVKKTTESVLKTKRNGSEEELSNPRGLHHRGRRGLPLTVLTTEGAVRRCFSERLALVIERGLPFTGLTTEGAVRHCPFHSVLLRKKLRFRELSNQWLVVERGLPFTGLTPSL